MRTDQEAGLARDRTLGRSVSHNSTSWHRPRAPPYFEPRRPAGAHLSTVARCARALLSNRPRPQAASWTAAAGRLVLLDEPRPGLAHAPDLAGRRSRSIAQSGDELRGNVPAVAHRITSGEPCLA